ncbi:hypothetical protein ES754_09280 [Psychrobacter frigidicola]|uniref:SPOR domain-containing protein n=1 Tax=Psychrobacter frigidicola TaxID=45611 RepID=A0A5C7A3D2_9GAMM|nr:hypothetical protein [Psychrobacter frigidicola]TXD96340.1 hypothetical protein ES754_09280 [Psychrobacter frigidicola]
MAAPSTTTRPASKSYRRQAIIWLLMTLLLGIATALLWMFTQTPAVGAKIDNAPITAPEALGAELEQPLSIAALHELDTDVQPINFEETVRDLRNYPDEFKDKRYLLANKGKWTVQVMNVGENDVIVSYLEGREDRAKFSYFRYRDEDNQLRYMLTYGIMGSPQEAVGAAKLIDFGLPADVRVLPEEINRYVSIIDNYERPLPIKDLSTRRSRAVKLRPTKREVPVRQRPQAPKKSNNSDSSARNKDESSRKSNSGNDSIKQSADTSATFNVNEERTLSSDTDATSNSKDGDKSRKSEQDSKKPPVVATPKPPSSASNPTTDSKKSDADKNSSDSMKELIQEKSN